MAESQAAVGIMLESGEDEDRGSDFTEPPLTVDQIVDGLKMVSQLSGVDFDNLTKSLEEMQSVQISTAVIGSSGTGKSSYINNMLGLTEGDEGAASIGDGGTTIEPTPYRNPHIEQLTFYDFPGFGSRLFKMTDAYLEEMKVEEYDFFLVFYFQTISEDDKWIIENLLALKKKFALVRTRADEMAGRSQPLEQRIKVAKSKCKQNLQHFGIRVDFKTFIISNTNACIGEMDALFNFVENNLPYLQQRKAIILFVQAQTAEVIRKKEQYLLDRAWKGATAMAIATGVPVPFIDIPINYKLLDDEIKSYLVAFGLSAEMYKNIPPLIKKRLKTAPEIHKEGIKGYIGLYIAKAPVVVSVAFVQQAIEICLPIVGSLITGTVSFAYYLNFLRNTIRKLAKDANTLRKFSAESAV